MPSAMPSTSRTPSQGEEEVMTRLTGHSEASNALTSPGTGWGSASGGATPAPEMRPQAAVLLRVDGLCKKVSVRTRLSSKAYVSAGDNVSFTVEAGTTLGIVGETGCGKSTTARLVLGLIAPDAGSVAFEDVDVQTLTGPHRKTLRRNM